MRRAEAGARGKLDAQPSERPPPRPSDMPSTPTAKGGCQGAASGSGGGSKGWLSAGGRRPPASAPLASAPACSPSGGPSTHSHRLLAPPQPGLVPTEHSLVTSPPAHQSAHLPTHQRMSAAAATGGRADVNLHTDATDKVHLEVDTHEGTATGGTTARGGG